MGLSSCACVPPDGDDWSKPWPRECEHHAALRKDAERWHKAVAAYERGLVMGHNGQTGEVDGYVSLFLLAIRERESDERPAQPTVP